LAHLGQHSWLCKPCRLSAAPGDGHSLARSLKCVLLLLVLLLLVLLVRLC